MRRKGNAVVKSPFRAGWSRRRAVQAGAILALFAVLGCGGAALWLSRRPSHPEPPFRYPAPLFDPAETPMLEDPKRDEWQQPARVVRTLRLRPGQAVADIGAGSGYLLPDLSRAVGPAGTVYAQEIQREFLPALNRRAKWLKNVRVVLGTADDPGLPAASVDTYVLMTVYHEVQEPVRWLRTLRRSARPGARLAILDFDAARRGYPPAPIGHEIPEATVIREAEAAGWRLEERHEFLSSQFFLVFRLQEQ